MANYVYHKVVCSKEFLERYLIDEYPLGSDKKISPPYISFNKLFGMTDLIDYGKKFGEYIYYGCGFSYAPREDGRFEVKFATTRDYPMPAIHRAIELDHLVEWFAVEESYESVSHFIWSTGVQELIHPLGEEFDKYYEEEADFDESLDDADNLVWYYLDEYGCQWE